MNRLHAFLAAMLTAACCLVLPASRTAPSSGPLPFLQPRAAADGYTPPQLAVAYGYQPLYDAGITGAGQTVALLELTQYDSGDVAQFDSRYHLTAPDVREIYVGQQAHTPGRGAETDFDVEWLHALAPGAAIQIYYLDPAEPLWPQFAHAFKLARSNGAQTISVSIGMCHKSRGYTAVKRTLHTLLNAGVSVFAASGDYGDRPGPARMCGTKLGVSFPAADASVVAVGGTSVQLNPDDSLRREVAWRMSGGGEVAGLTRFPWQHAPTMPTGTRRWAPDVAFLGDQHTGVTFEYNGQWDVAGGTSLGAPAWAAAWALVRQDVASTGTSPQSAARLLYRIGNSSLYNSDFNDITSGSNGKYRAAVGWDAVTGWGTPDVANIAATVKGWIEAG